MYLYIFIALVVVVITPRIIKRIHKFPVPFLVTYFLDSGLRRWLQPPAAMIFRSGIKSGMTVLELGCGSGSCTLDIARVIGGKGKLHAVDIQQAMIQKLRIKLERAENRDLNNIEVRLASAYQLPFADSFFDVVCLVDVLQEIPDAGRALQEIRRVLKNKGILAISEFLVDTDYPLRRTTRRQCKKAGYKLKASRGNFFSYTLQFIK